MPGRESDRGSATVWTVGALAVLCVVFTAVLALGQAVVVRHRAGGAADLAALAAADHWWEGGTEACARADRVARVQGTSVVRCAVRGDTSDVTVAAGRGLLTARVRSRAGPAGPVAPGPAGFSVPGPTGFVTPDPAGFVAPGPKGFGARGGVARPTRVPGGGLPGPVGLVVSSGPEASAGSAGRAGAGTRPSPLPVAGP